MKQFLFLILIISGLLSCKSDTKNTYGAKPIALGRLNDIVVVADDADWEGMAGDTFRHYFESAYPIMPSPEPMFDLRHFTVKQINAEPLRKELRTYVILANLEDAASPATQLVKSDIGEERFQKALTDDQFVTLIGKDRWARGQIVIYLFGKDKAALAAAIKSKFSSISQRIRGHDEEQLYASIYTVKRENAGASALIQKWFGLDIKIPGDYKIAINEPKENILWLKRDDNDSSSSIIFRQFDYDTDKQMSNDTIIRLRDEYGKVYIAGPTEDSYMRTNTKDLPVYDYTLDLNGSYAKELRGIWEMKNDYMGGPFISFAILNKTTNKLILVDTFVYAPGKSKRDLVQQLEYIIKQSKVL